MLAQVVCRRNEVLHIRREVRRRELPLARTEAGKVETQQRDAPLSGNPSNCVQDLRAREAVRKEGVGADRPVGKFETRGEGGA